MGVRQYAGRLISIESHRTTLGLTAVFNLVDAVLTLIWILTGHAIEANPLMASALDFGPVIFMLTKITVVSLGLTILWIRRKRVWVRYAALAIFGMYSYVMMIHASFILDTILDAFR